MTMATRVVESTPSSQGERHRVLLVHEEQVVLTQNHSDTGPAIPILSSLLLDSTIHHAYVAGTRLFELLIRLNDMMQDHVPGWRMRITNRQRRAFHSNGEERITGRFFVDYIVLEQSCSNGSKHSTRRRPLKKLDIINLDLLKDRSPSDLNIQMEVVLALIEMCEHRAIRMRGTRGGLGAALLKKSPHWHKGRKPAPKFINQKIKKHLPGNFYSLSAKVEKSYKPELKAMKHCFYLDQTNAHHSIASTLALPHPEDVHARGFHQTEVGRWAQPHTSLGESVLAGEHLGLVLCKLFVSRNLTPHLVPDWAQKRGTKYVWLWTPELRLLKDEQRFTLDYFVAAYSATQGDPVLREYAKWALAEINGNPEGSIHKKSCLLAAYGMLAFSTDKRAIYRYWGDSRPGPRVAIPGCNRVREKKIEIREQFSIVNVLARGMIESETRTRTLEYAQELHTLGFHIPQVYADGFLIETETLPFIKNGWRISHSLTNVFFSRSNAIISDQVVKLPGIAGSELDRDWELRREQARQPFVITGRLDQSHSV